MSNHLKRTSTAPLVTYAFVLGMAFVTPALHADDEHSAQPARSEAKAPADNENTDAWRTDLAAFESYLKSLATAARMPTEEDFAKRDPQDRDWKVITDRDGGVLDFKPGEDTVQFRVNEAVKGKTVRWEFELGWDASYGEQVGLAPSGVPKAVRQFQRVA